MSENQEPYCALCGRRQHLVRVLKQRGEGFICGDCDNLQISGATEAAIMRSRDPAVNDPYRRYQVDSQTKHQLRSQFQTIVAEPHDPEKPRISQGDEQVNGFSAHPLLNDAVQFSGLNENMKLPNMDPEQWDNYLQNQLDLQNQKRLEKVYQDTMVPRRN